jgi:hypothetical protein
VAGYLERTVFISYRRSDGTGWALAVAHDLAAHGFDVFFDYRGVDSGDFRQVIIEAIKARAHFIVLLTPLALTRIDDPDDMFRVEIEAAMHHRRNVVPLMLDGFDFAERSTSLRLSGSVAGLKKYNGLTVPAEYFDAAMIKLRARFLSIPLETVLHPPSDDAATFVRAEQHAIEGALSGAPAQTPPIETLPVLQPVESPDSTPRQRRTDTVARMWAAAAGNSVTVFAHDDGNSEERFAALRRTHPNAWFATRTSNGTWRIHHLHCSSLDYNGGHKLTASPKVVATNESDLYEWARRFGVETTGCSRCRKLRKEPSAINGA